MAQLQSPYVLHPATHGFFLPKAPNEASQMLLAPTESNVGGSFLRNPMLRSGLALAGAQTTLDAWKRGEVPPSENDDIQTAHEVGSVNLTDT